MKRYYTKLQGVTELNSKAGSNIDIPIQSYQHVGRIISATTFAQSLIQSIVLRTYAQKLEEAMISLKDLTSPTSRLAFLNAFGEIDTDPIVSKVFRYAKELFSDVYLLRNVLVHETWRSSQQYPSCILLSNLNEEARLQNASYELARLPSATSAKTFNAIVRYIGSVRAVSFSQLDAALADINVSNWCLMQIDFILKQTEENNKEEIKKAFLVFKGVSHLFNERERAGRNVNWSSSENHSINQ